MKKILVGIGIIILAIELIFLASDKTIDRVEKMYVSYYLEVNEMELHFYNTFKYNGHTKEQITDSYNSLVNNLQIKKQELYDMDIKKGSLIDEYRTALSNRIDAHCRVIKEAYDKYPFNRNIPMWVFSQYKLFNGGVEYVCQNIYSKLTGKPEIMITRSIKGNVFGQQVDKIGLGIAVIDYKITPNCLSGGYDIDIVYELKNMNKRKSVRFENIKSEIWFKKNGFTETDKYNEDRFYHLLNKYNTSKNFGSVLQELKPNESLYYGASYFVKDQIGERVFTDILSDANIFMTFKIAGNNEVTYLNRGIWPKNI